MEELKNNKNVLNRGSWIIRWRSVTVIILAAAAGGYIVYEKWLEYLPVLIGFASICLIMFLISLRSVAVWKSRHLILAENPKEVWEKARLSFLRTSIMEAMSLWKFGERREFHRQYDERIKEMRALMKERGEELYAEKDELHVHKAFGASVVIMVLLLILLLGSLLWFRYRDDVTERILSAVIFIVAIVLLVIQVQVVLKRNKDVIRINKHGLKFKAGFVPWSEVTYIDVEAGKNLVYQQRGHDEERVDLSSLSRTPHEIDEAIMYFRNLLHEPPANHDESSEPQN